MSACREFRAGLERALSGSGATDDLSRLGWHEHLLGCADCRAVLESERALEDLLAALPSVALPPELAERVLERLRARERLDRLLELDRRAPAPAGLAGDLLHRLAPERAAAAGEAALDALLARVPAPEVPGHLVERTLRALAAERGARRPRLVPLRGGRLAAAALVLVALGLGAWRVLRAVDSEPAGDHLRGVEVASSGETLDEPPEPEDALLESLAVLETWDLLLSADVEAFLAGAYDPVEDALLEWTEDVGDEPAPPAEEPPERG